VLTAQNQDQCADQRDATFHVVADSVLQGA
jgi:hypothetical protein